MSDPLYFTYFLTYIYYLSYLVIYLAILGKNQRIICYVAGHAVALLYCANKPAVVREKFVKIVTGLPGVPVTEDLNFFENEYSKNQLFPPILIFLLNM